MKKFTARIVPPDARQRLLDAGSIVAINAVTDDLVKRGMCRPRTDVSLFKPTAKRNRKS